MLQSLKRPAIAYDLVGLATGSSVAVGRESEAKIRLDSPEVPFLLSRKHAVFTFQPGALVGFRVNVDQLSFWAVQLSGGQLPVHEPPAAAPPFGGKGVLLLLPPLPHLLHILCTGWGRAGGLCCVLCCAELNTCVAADGSLILKDLGSTNGTYVARRGQTLRKLQGGAVWTLEPGDVIGFGTRWGPGP